MSNRQPKLTNEWLLTIFRDKGFMKTVWEILGDEDHHEFDLDNSMNKSMSWIEFIHLFILASSIRQSLSEVSCSSI